MRLLNELADNALLKRVRGSASTDDEQETDRELILRFFAMAGHMHEYRMPLSNFLNDEADRGIRLDDAVLRQRQALFEKAIGNVRMLAGMLLPMEHKGMPCLCWSSCRSAACAVCCH